MVHYLEYYTHATLDNNVAVLSIDKKWFEDWFNVFDLYKIAKICYQPTIRIPSVSKKFRGTSLAKYYVNKIKVVDDIVSLQLVLFYNQNKWLDKEDGNLIMVDTDEGTDYVLLLDVPIAEVNTNNQDYAVVLDYICSTFTKCIKENIQTDL